MVNKHIPDCLGPEDNFGLAELCKFETLRYLFFADHKFTVGLDETDYRYLTGEVEIFAENSEKAHANTDALLNCYVMHARILMKAKTFGRVDDTTEVFRRRYAAHQKVIPNIRQCFGDKVIDVRYKPQSSSANHSSLPGGYVRILEEVYENMRSKVK